MCESTAKCAPLVILDNMNTMESRRDQISPWAWILIWTAVALFFVTEAQLYIAFEQGKEPAFDFNTYAWSKTLLWEFSGWYLWGFLSIGIYRLAKRFPLEKNRWIRHLPIHILVSPIFAFGHMALHVTVLTLFDRLMENGYQFSYLFTMDVVNRFTWRIVVYFVALAGCHLILLQRKFREEERRADRLETQLARAELDAMKMQLQPHFLFNTLQSISELMHQDIEAADEMMVRLSHFLRLSLESSSSREVTLQRELEFLRSYLEIEELRFRDRLRVRMEIDPDTLVARVPNLILQPIVENAIRHGIAPQAQGEIEIRTTRRNGMLCLQVRDNGAGIQADTVPKAGIGLSNTRTRLEQHYGKQQKLELSQLKEGGVVVTLELPFKVHVGDSENP